mmetsp:Transcript_23455/g.40098  ORF Transcript_23455/g.40098 Transcript_23455/m.40098 type:complete len:176 (-) Transcript_23455:48-575(-)
MLMRTAARRAAALPQQRQLLARTLCSKKPGDALSTDTSNVKPNMGFFTGAPQTQTSTRVVKIFQPANTVVTGNQNTLVWRMQWEDASTKRWTNPLMGWSSTSDPLSNTHLTLEFQTAEDAVRFCDENGWKSQVVPTKPNRALHAKPKKYADNFKWQGPKGRSFPDLYVPPPPPPK